MSASTIGALMNEDLDMVRVLLSHGADPDARLPLDVTPLDEARRAGQSEMVALLAAVSTEGSPVAPSVE
jgi:ankyrin repeat protein